MTAKNKNFQINKNDILLNKGLFSAQNIVSGIEAVLMSTHNLFFRAEIKKKEMYFTENPNCTIKRCQINIGVLS